MVSINPHSALLFGGRNFSHEYNEIYWISPGMFSEVFS